MSFIKTMGLLLAIFGLATEGLAVMAMGYRPIRKRLRSPFVVQSAGFALFVVGLLLYAIGKSHMSR